jgi:exodeoxyribonuclease V beta subunit
MNPMLPKKLDPLSLRLQGQQVIEASAGTGKTWTLAALYVRLVLGHEPAGVDGCRALLPPQILVMTFTDAATAELRARIRKRLAQAALFFAQNEQADADAFLHQLRAGIAPCDWPQCAARLDMAAQWMDDAAIYTIHGWSSRMLKSHAFDSASLFVQSRVEDAEKLLLLAAQDYWREWFYPLRPEQLGALQGLGNTPLELLKRVEKRRKQTSKSPQLEATPDQSPAQLLHQWTLWQSRFLLLESAAVSACTEALVGLLADTIGAKKLKGYRADWPGKLRDWAQAGSMLSMNKADREACLKTLERFGLAALRAKNWADADLHPAFAAFDALLLQHAQEPQVSEQLIQHAAFEIDRAYQQAKARLAQFDFSDLLQNLYHALQASDGRLAQAIRDEFPVALVDEFQDTDPWQYGALRSIYGQSDDPSAAAKTALIMIGDPKQAIYSFRGADLATYLSARQQAQAVHTLTGNFRSTAGVVAAVNHVFGQAKLPFGDLPFEKVDACNPNIQPLQVAGQVQPAMTVWHLPRGDSLNKNSINADMAQVFATQMVALLNQKVAQPGDMAVLVRNWSEARAIRLALAQRAVPSVYLSQRDSVFASQQASDLWHVLRAVATPSAGKLLRAALATRLWGKNWAELDALFQDEAAWDAMTERVHHWQAVWQRQGFLPMLHHWLHEQQIAQRLLQQSEGERALTNVLHLGDLLQSASQSLQGEAALIRYFENQLRDPSAGAEAAQLRLESDAALVQVVTLHKSKGLQYPLVFLPFVSNYTEQDAAPDDALRLAEDVRLLYVGMTRAEQALWLGVAQTFGDVDGKTPVVKSAISQLLARKDPTDLAQRLQTWADGVDGAASGAGATIVVQSAPIPNMACYCPRVQVQNGKAAKVPQRQLRSRWWSASFSALTRAVEPSAAPASELPSWLDERVLDAQVDARANDVSVTGQFNAFPAGSVYGTLLHDLLQWHAQNDWPDAQHAGWQKLLQRHAQRLHLDEAQQALLVSWFESIVSTRLTLSVHSVTINLRALRACQYWSEMAFSLKVENLQSARLDALIQHYIHPECLRQTLAEQTLQGMLTGFIDLVLEVEGRYYVLDYKSNKLASYAPAALQQAILAHRYDVQYTLYLLALHRLLRSRLPDYDYDRHVGGALYWFLRGIDQRDAGLYVMQAPKALIEALDAAFSGCSALPCEASI